MTGASGPLSRPGSAQKRPSGLKAGSNHLSDVIDHFPNSLPVNPSATLDAMFSHMHDAVIKINEDKKARNQAKPVQSLEVLLMFPMTKNSQSCLTKCIPLNDESDCYHYKL